MNRQNTTTSRSGRMNVGETHSKNYGRRGILKEQTGDENIQNIAGEDAQPMIEREVDGVFEIITQEGAGSWIGMGAFRLSEIQSKEECRRQIQDKSWELIINLTGAMIAGRDMLAIKESGKKQFNNEK